jgi:hypothetical protein
MPADPRTAAVSAATAMGRRPTTQEEDADWPSERGPIPDLIGSLHGLFTDFLDEHPDCPVGEVIVAVNFFHEGAIVRLAEQLGLDPRATDVFLRGAAEDFRRSIYARPVPASERSPDDGR